ncbi:MAG: DNA polymerase III subunit delta' [Coriobacteriales bacterium]|nr:DNA polymerase III subunit delta' [Actinomycetes bacterium]
MTTPRIWDAVATQRRIASFLSKAVTSGAVAHAYLFVGPTGTGKMTAARALACALLCDDGGCGECPVCYRILNGSHPDVHVFTPEGAATYVIDQVRQIIRDVHLKPVQARRKVYVIDEADRLNQESANAFLKTLEEPPGDVVMILLAQSYDAVLPTIASRCQVVRFRPVAPSVAEALLVQRTGADRAEARAALAAAGGVVSRAEEIVRSPARMAARTVVLDVLKRLPIMDAHDVIVSARELLSAVKAPLDELKGVQVAEREERRELLGTKASMKSLEERHKRELTAKERDGIREVLNVAASWLRDCMLLSQDPDAPLFNTDTEDAIEEVARVMTPSAALTALGAVEAARRRISYNVSPQLAIEAMLFDIQEVLKCPR